VRGGAGGGGLGLLYAADIVVAADDARFALGYGALGLTADGGNTWFLPRMVGMRRAQELFLLNRRLTAQEALAFGLVSRLAPNDAVETEAATLAATLAAGPTRAFGAGRGHASASTSQYPSERSVLAGQWCSRSTRAATDFADCKNMPRLRQRTMICKFVSPSHAILSRQVR
jgi:enoyl-CoA hydratase/carnithine racemase